MLKHLILKNYTVYPAKLFVKDMKQDLLEEAKCRYPVGCKFKSALNKKEQVVYCDNYDNYRNHSVFVQISDNEVPQIDYLYYYNRWAGYVEVFGFKVGDVIDKDILNKWRNLHQEYNSVTKKWFCEYDWEWSPAIQAIDYIDNTILFKMGDITWIKAEGLREFIEQQNKNNMKPQTLTLGQLKDLYQADNCLDWRDTIMSYITANTLQKDDYKVVIRQEDIKHAKKNASKAQLKLLQDAGLKFEEECPFKIGDWVVVLPEDKYYENCEQGKAQQIKNITDFVNCPYDLKFSNGTWNSYKLIRKATEAEIKYAQIEWDKLKTGSVVRLNGRCFPGFDLSKPVNIVFYKTNQSIDIYGNFVNGSCITTTINQNDIYYNCSDMDDYIKEVISY